MITTVQGLTADTPPAGTLPLPPHFQVERVGEVWRVPYQHRAAEAEAWARQHGIPAAATDRVRVGLLLIDVQNTFCIPGFELFVAGSSGLGAVEDNQRLCQFIYRNLARITQIIPTLDTHTAMQIFHPIFWVDGQGSHPQPATAISVADIRSGRWQVNPAVAASLTQGDLTALQAHALHYAEQLEQGGKYPLIVWPYHSMLGGIGHALVPAVEEAIFFHSLARHSQASLELKGANPLTENYSVLSPEVLTGPEGDPIDEKNDPLIRYLLGFDALIVAGQAKSHCVAWTVSDLLQEIQTQDPKLAQKIYLLEDCTSAVVIPGVVDFSEQAEAAFATFAAAGMHRVRSTDPMEDWPDFPRDSGSAAPTQHPL
ncbi:isochorismatase [Thermostichus vulcanus]|uniref:Isochorismatase n=1 Tax=Thermostichus vulcanus str. 'Rupite' TaxID=2813851 RepID=A0ABT0CCV2_THEVL|nr:isochorismatase [Thermostichus vulcanus]MCJ2543554.1 isochorismatase [Thermostichus vulcanus str. 'Rupite']